MHHRNDATQSTCYTSGARGQNAKYRLAWVEPANPGPNKPKVRPDPEQGTHQTPRGQESTQDDAHPVWGCSAAVQRGCRYSYASKYPKVGAMSDRYRLQNDLPPREEECSRLQLSRCEWWHPEQCWPSAIWASNRVSFIALYTASVSACQHQCIKTERAAVGWQRNQKYARLKTNTGTTYSTRQEQLLSVAWMAPVWKKRVVNVLKCWEDNKKISELWLCAANERAKEIINGCTTHFCSSPSLLFSSSVVPLTPFYEKQTFLAQPKIKRAPINLVSLFTHHPAYWMSLNVSLAQPRGTDALPGRHGVRVWSPPLLTAQLFRCRDRLTKFYCLKNSFHVLFFSPYTADFIVNFTVQWDKCFPQTFLHIKYSGVIWTWLKYSLGPVLYHLSMQKILKSSGTYSKRS